MDGPLLSRLYQMGIVKRDGEINVENMRLFTRIYAAQFYYNLCDSLSLIHILRNTRPMEPIRLSGIHIITMMDSRGESNWMAMTRNTRKMPAAMAVAMLSRPSAVLSSCLLYTSRCV